MCCFSSERICGFLGGFFATELGSTEGFGSEKQWFSFTVATCLLIRKDFCEISHLMEPVGCHFYYISGESIYGF